MATFASRGFSIKTLIFSKVVRHWVLQVSFLSLDNRIIAIKCACITLALDLFHNVNHDFWLIGITLHYITAASSLWFLSNEFCCLLWTDFTPQGQSKSWGQRNEVKPVETADPLGGFLTQKCLFTGCKTIGVNSQRGACKVDLTSKSFLTCFPTCDEKVVGDSTIKTERWYHPFSWVLLALSTAKIWLFYGIITTSQLSLVRVYGY